VQFLVKIWTAKTTWNIKTIPLHKP